MGNWALQTEKRMNCLCSARLIDFASLLLLMMDILTVKPKQSTLPWSKRAQRQLEINLIRISLAQQEFDHEFKYWTYLSFCDWCRMKSIKLSSRGSWIIQHNTIHLKTSRYFSLDSLTEQFGQFKKQFPRVASIMREL